MDQHVARCFQGQQQPPPAASQLLSPRTLSQLLPTLNSWLCPKLAARERDDGRGNGRRIREEREEAELL